VECRKSSIFFADAQKWRQAMWQGQDQCTFLIAGSRAQSHQQESEMPWG
jgi:hypothetical protein